MIDRFEIIDSGSSRPAGSIIFCDGTGGGFFQPQTDLELSHWRPNRTPTEYRAGTSTEICFRFLDHPRPGSWTVAVNNHVDVDGILSVYVLLNSQHAQAHRQTIVQAAEMGDFWGWGEAPAQRVFQSITRLMSAGSEGKTVYAEAFRRLPEMIDGSELVDDEIEESLTPLRRGVGLIEKNEIHRTQLSDRLAQYVVPRAVAGDDDAKASYCPEFNEAISDAAVLWPQARARWDAQRACLVSVERAEGWFHDLWFPGYLWADTEGLWRVPGMAYHDGMASYRIDNPRLIAAFEELQRPEHAPGRWGLGGTNLPFGEELQEKFPLAGRFLDEHGNPAISQQSPHDVAKMFAGVFD